MRKIEVTLNGAQGTRKVEVSQTGFTTRHIQAPRESVPSIFGDVSLVKQPLASPLSSTTEDSQPTPESTPHDANEQSLSELLAEVDAILYPQRKSDNPNWKPVGYHYTGYVKPKPDYDSGLYAYWNAMRQRKSDVEMAYRRERAKTREQG